MTEYLFARMEDITALQVQIDGLTDDIFHNLSDPNIDAIPMWDDSDGAAKWASAVEIRSIAGLDIATTTDGIIVASGTTGATRGTAVLIDASNNLTLPANLNLKGSSATYEFQNSFAEDTSWYNGLPGIAWAMDLTGGASPHQIMYLIGNSDWDTSLGLLPNGGVPGGSDVQLFNVGDAFYWTSTNKLRIRRLLDGTSYTATAALSGGATGNITGITLSTTLTGYAPSTTYKWAVNGGGGPSPSNGPRLGPYNVVSDASGHITASSFRAADGNALSAGNPVVGPWTSAPFIAVDPPPLTTAGIKAADAISGTGVPGATTVLTVDSTTQITMSANASATNTRVLLTVGANGLKYYGNTTSGSAIVTAVHGRFFADVGLEFFRNRSTAPYGMSAGSIIGQDQLSFILEDGSTGANLRQIWNVENGSVTAPSAYYEFDVPGDSNVLTPAIAIGRGVWDLARRSTSPGFGILEFAHLVSADVTIDAAGSLFFGAAGANAIIANTLTNALTYTASQGHFFVGSVIPNATNSYVCGNSTNAWSSVGSRQLDLFGATSGAISILPQAAAGTYNFNLPTGAGTAGQPLLSGGGAAAPMTFGTLDVPAGGTNIANYTTGDMLYASAGQVLSRLGAVAVGNALISGGTSTAPSWGKIDLTAHISGVLPVANGGTNASAAGITAFNNITGYTAAGATGTTSTNLVFSTSPSITTPTFITSATVPQIYGGTAAGATLLINATSHGTPSGGSITLYASDAITLRGSPVNIGVANVQGSYLVVAGNASGSQEWKTAGAASGTITFPAGTVDFSATGGASQVVKQTSAGGIFTVAQLSQADISGLTTASSPQFTSVTIQRSGGAAVLTFFRTDTHGDSAIVSQFDFFGRDDAAAAQAYAQVTGVAISDAAGAATGDVRFATVQSGTLANRFIVGAGLYTAGATGGDKGVDTINAGSAYYTAGTKVVGAQGAAVADASGGATVDAEARTAINTLLARLRTHGLIAT